MTMNTIPVTAIDLNQLPDNALVSPVLTITERLNDKPTDYVIALLALGGDEDALIITRQGVTECIAINASDLSGAWRAVYEQ